MHPDTATVFVVIAGHVQFNIEGQQPIAAVRGSIVNVPRTTVYSAEVGGDSNALWVEVNPANYKAVYPAADPAPKAVSGGEVIKIAFGHTPGVYRAPNRPHWNLFQAIETCDERGAKASRLVCVPYAVEFEPRQVDFADEAKLVDGPRPNMLLISDCKDGRA